MSDAYDEDEYHPDDWPSDATENDLPDYIEPADFDGDSGKPLDSNGRRYNPYQGSRSAHEGRCNAMLDGWDDRYNEPRYCMRLPENKFVDGGSEYCKVHKSQEALMERARDVFKHGLYSKTIKHTFGKLSPWQQLVCLGFYDSYVGESVYDYEVKMHDFTIDFGRLDDEVLDSLPLEVQFAIGEDEQMDIGVPIPTAHEVRAWALFRAAVKDMQATLADGEMLPELDGDHTAMESSTVIDTVEDDEGNVVNTVEDDEEHHLALPVSRVDKDRDDLMRFGGVPIDSDADVEMNVDTPDSLIMDLGNDETTDPSVEDDSPATALEGVADDAVDHGDH